MNVFHSGRFKLEYRRRIAAGKHFIGFAVVQRHLIHVQINTVLRFDPVDGAFNHRQGFQPQKVKLNQAGFFHKLHVILGHRHIGAGILIQRHQLV